MNIYLPMTVPQALALLRLRLDALFGGESVRGYHSHDDAIAARRRQDGDEFALVTLSYDDVAHEKLAREGKVNGVQAVCPHTGFRMWVMTGDARSDLSRSARFSMEIIPGEGRRAFTATTHEWGGGPLGNGGC